MRTMITACLTLILLLPLLAVAQADPHAMPDSHPHQMNQVQQHGIPQNGLQVLGYLIGTWEGRYEAPGQGIVTERVIYTRASESLLNVKGSVTNAQGKQIEGGTGTVQFDPTQNKVTMRVSSQNAVDPFFSIQVKHEGNVLWMDGVAGAVMPHFRTKIVFVDQNTYEVTTFLPEGHGWKQIASAAYKRVQ